MYNKSSFRQRDSVCKLSDVNHTVPLVPSTFPKGKKKHFVAFYSEVTQVCASQLNSLHLMSADI